MRIALDTNRYTDLANALPEAIGMVAAADEVIVPFCVIAELRSGFLGGTRQRLNESQLQQFLRQPAVEVIYPDSATVDLWAHLRIDATKRGRTLPHNDVWIAAICVQHGLRLFTRDKHFDDLPQVMKV